MITDEIQYHVTVMQADRFAQAVALLERDQREKGVLMSAAPHDVLHKAQLDALRSQLDSLQYELAEYEESGVPVHGEATSDGTRIAE